MMTIHRWITPNVSWRARTALTALLCTPGVETTASARKWRSCEDFATAVARLDATRAEAANLFPGVDFDSIFRARREQLLGALRHSSDSASTSELPFIGDICIKASWRINARVPEGGKLRDELTDEVIRHDDGRPVLTETALMGTGLQVALMDREQRAKALAAREQSRHEQEQKRLKTQKRRRQRRKARR